MEAPRDGQENCLQTVCFRANHFTKREVPGMRHLHAVLVTLSMLLWAGAVGSVAVASQVVWSEEAEKSATPSGMRFGTAVADDAAASGGQAERIPYEAGANGWSIVYSAPRMEMRGQVLFTFWLRAENLPPLTPGFVLTLVAHDKQTGQWAFHRETRVYAVNLQTQGYTPINLTLDVPWTAETYGPEVILRWDAPPEGVTPVMYLDKSEISVPVLDAPRVREVSPAKVRYQPREKVTVLTSLANPTAAAVEGTLVGEEIRAADTRREVFREKVALAAGEEKQVASPYHAWKAYMRRMMSWGDRVNKLGGVYNPYDFNRGSIYCPIDLIYSAIFRIICGGRDYGGWYYNSRQPVGDYGAFTTRFSEYLHNANRDWIPEVKAEVEVESAAPLWWREMCFWTHASDGRKCLQVNLVNPPRVAEVMENPHSEITPPVQDVTVTCAPSEGQKPAAAYLLMSEPFELTGLNHVEVVKLDLRDAGEGKVAVTVPSVLFWKMVVFRFEEP